MALIQQHKIVSSLPGTLAANAIYYVRVGTGFDIYVTNSIGTIVAYPLNQASSSGGGAAGNAVVNFGAGLLDAQVVVTGQTSILASSSVHASVRVAASADHTADEHWVEEVQVFAGNIVPGVGFTIYARATKLELFGQWNVSWIWK